MRSPTTTTMKEILKVTAPVALVVSSVVLTTFVMNKVYKKEPAKPKTELKTIIKEKIVEKVIYKTIFVEKKEPVVKINPKKLEYSKELINGIKHFENDWLSKKDSSYKVTTKYDKLGKCYEIGYGFTNNLIETAVRYGRLPKGYKLPKTMTKKECDTFLVEVAIPTFHDAVKKHVDRPITLKQRDALIMFAYNLGDGALRRLVDGENRLNGGKINNTTKIMKKYCYADGKVCRGLKKRRDYEIKLFNNTL